MSISRSQYSFPQQLASARLVSTGNIAGSYLNGNLNNGVGATLTVSSLTTIDSVTLVVGDRVLLVGQSNANENGIYVVNSVGTNAVLERANDFQNIEQIKEGQYIPISAGTANAGAIYVVVEPIPGHLGVDAVDFSPASVPSGSTFLVKSNNLSDLANAATARTNLGLGTAAVAAASTFQQVSSIKAGTTGNIGGAGAGPIDVTVAGLTSGSVVVATIASSSNAVGVAKAVAASGKFTVTFTADPGATCTLNYVAFIAAQ